MIISYLFISWNLLDIKLSVYIGFLGIFCVSCSTGSWGVQAFAKGEFQQVSSRLPGCSLCITPFARQSLLSLKPFACLRRCAYYFCWLVYSCFPIRDVSQATSQMLREVSACCFLAFNLLIYVDDNPKICQAPVLSAEAQMFGFEMDGFSTAKIAEDDVAARARARELAVSLINRARAQLGAGDPVRAEQDALQASKLVAPQVRLIFSCRMLQISCQMFTSSVVAVLQGSHLRQGQDSSSWSISEARPVTWTASLGKASPKLSRSIAVIKRNKSYKYITVILFNFQYVSMNKLVQWKFIAKRCQEMPSANRPQQGGRSVAYGVPSESSVEFAGAGKDFDKRVMAGFRCLCREAQERKKDKLKYS